MSDLIDRQLVLDRINKQREYLRPDLYPYDEIVDSAYRICAEFVERLSSAESDLEWRKKYYEIAYNQGYVDACKYYENLPECKKGKWIATYSDYDGDVWVSWKCSNCGYVRKKGWKYTDDGKNPDALFCEMCNADMRGEQDDSI